MKTIVQVVLNFLLNAIWQAAAIALAAVVGNYLLRSVTRFRHALWVSALIMSLALPIFSTIISLKRESAPAVSEQNKIIEPVVVVPANVVTSNIPPAAASVTPSIHVSQRVAIVILIAFLVLLIYRAVKLSRAWLKTRAIRRSAFSFEPDADLSAIIERCQSALGVSDAKICSSRMIKTPATVGILNPLVVLPEALLSAGDANALTAAIGHELVHVGRRDYLLNLIYELMFLPLSFHPAAALMKRQITKTRELRCDELVVERLLHHEVYARSLVRLASWALPLKRRAQTIAVGIADADILEVRIMSLLRRKHSNLRRAVFGLMLAALLLAVPCVAAAALAIHFDIDEQNLVTQEPSREVQEKRELDARKTREVKERWEKETAELKQRIANETNAQIRADLEKALAQREQEKVTAVYTLADGGYAVSLRGNEEGARQEREREEKQKTELARAAKISMDQAIQIATSASPGKVIECSLVGERWSGEGELAKPSKVLYHVVILSGDEANPGTNHVMVNALDGSVVTVNKEERKRDNPEFLYERRREPIQGGVLNGKAISLPLPEYSEVAKQAKASGAVTVQVTIDETGHVIEARAVSGHPLLQAAAVAAARQSVFAPTKLSGEPVQVSGALVYNFVAQ